MLCVLVGGGGGGGEWGKILLLKDLAATTEINILCQIWRNVRQTQQITNINISKKMNMFFNQNIY